LCTGFSKEKPTLLDVKIKGRGGKYLKINFERLKKRSINKGNGKENCKKICAKKKGL